MPADYRPKSCRMTKSDQPDDHQAENPYRAPEEGQGITQPQWRQLPSMALYVCALLPGLLAIMMAYHGIRWIDVYRRAGGLGLPEVVMAIALLLGALICASVAAVLIWIARRISR